MKQQIMGWVSQIDDIQKQISEHWTMVQKSVAAGDADKAITLLNAYFRLKTKAEGVEAQLRGMLGGPEVVIVQYVEPAGSCFNL